MLEMKTIWMFDNRCQVIHEKMWDVFNLTFTVWPLQDGCTLNQTSSLSPEQPLILRSLFSSVCPSSTSPVLKCVFPAAEVVPSHFLLWIPQREERREGGDAPCVFVHLCKWDFAICRPEMSGVPFPHGVHSGLHVYEHDDLHTHRYTQSYVQNTHSSHKSHSLLPSTCFNSCIWLETPQISLLYISVMFNRLLLMFTVTLVDHGAETQLSDQLYLSAVCREQRLQQQQLLKQHRERCGKTKPKKSDVFIFNFVSRPVGTERLGIRCRSHVVSGADQRYQSSCLLVLGSYFVVWSEHFATILSEKEDIAYSSLPCWQIIKLSHFLY